MYTYVYKQNTGVLSKNQNFIVDSNVNFRVGCYTIKQTPDFKYNYYKCGDCYRLEIYLDNTNSLEKLFLVPSSCDYQVWVHLNKEYVYKENGRIVINLRNIETNNISIELKIKKGTAITLSLEDSKNNKKTVSFKVK